MSLSSKLGKISDAKRYCKWYIGCNSSLIPKLAVIPRYWEENLVEPSGAAT